MVGVPKMFYRIGDVASLAFNTDFVEAGPSLKQSLLYFDSVSNVDKSALPRRLVQGYVGDA